MGRHAYLIAAHNEFGILQKLVSLLDYKENDIYIHIDKSVKNFNENIIKENIKYADVFFVPVCSVNWGGYSQIKYEMNLLKEAVKRKHDYYHLISGVDLPIKSHSYIQDFFENNKGKEFIEFDECYEKKKMEYRVRYYHLFQDKVGKRKDFIGRLLLNVEKIIVKFQEFIKVNRTKNISENIYKGTNWFSITHDLALYIVSQEQMIKKHYRYTYCADEIFLHTLVMNSKFKNNIVNDCLRYIDWDRGQPYIFTDEDFNTLINSNKLWARKFSEQKDAKIVEHIYNAFK